MRLTRVDVVVIDAGGAAICMKLVSAFETSDAITGIKERYGGNISCKYTSHRRFSKHFVLKLRGA